VRADYTHGGEYSLESLRSLFEVLGADGLVSVGEHGTACSLGWRHDRQPRNAFA